MASPPSPDIVTLLSALRVTLARQVDELRTERRTSWKRRWRVELEHNLSARLSRLFQGEEGDLNLSLSYKAE